MTYACCVTSIGVHVETNITLKLTLHCKFGPTQILKPSRKWLMP